RSDPGSPSADPGLDAVSLAVVVLRTVFWSQHCRISDQETNGKTSVASSNYFSDQIYKEIAITNGYINRMTREELRSKLTEFKLETR
uniref:Uncharacterized protein n=1 Tax=Junco hyemalis TaxID=40217 RepID=A0A8C5IH08_JUNHY